MKTFKPCPWSSPVVAGSADSFFFSDSFCCDDIVRVVKAVNNDAAIFSGQGWTKRAQHYFEPSVTQENTVSITEEV